MSMPPDHVVPSGPSAAERLESWKEIADYFGKGVTTVRRWERVEGLPVRRLEHAKRGSVVAYRSELDEWLRSHTTALRENIEPAEAPHRRERGRAIAVGWIAAGLAIVAAAATLALAPASRRKPGEVEYRMLTADPGTEIRPSFAPGGERFAYAKDGRAIVVKRVGVEPAREIFKKPGANICSPRWSPDGRYIAISFMTREPDEWEIVLLDSASGRLEQSLGPGGPHLAWTPDGKALIYSHEQRLGGPTALFERSIDTGRVRQVSFPPDGSWGDIAGQPSPAGTQMVLTRFWDRGKGDVFVSDYGARQARRVTHLENWVVGVDWLPGGREVVFGGTVEGREGIHRVQIDGGTIPELVDGTAGVNRYPAVAALAGGKTRIAFVHEDWNQDLFRFDPTSGSLSKVAESVADEEEPDLSGTGRLVFQSARSGHMNLWVCEGACSEPRQITFLRQPYMIMAPRWSPDGRHIAYSSRQGDRYAILIAGAEGEDQHLVSSGSAAERVLSYSADGRSLYVRSNRTGAPGIWRVPVEGGGSTATQITGAGGGDAFESPDGRWLYFTPGLGKSLLMRRALDGRGPDAEVLASLGPVFANLWRPVGPYIYYWRDADLYRFDLAAGASALALSAPKGGRIFTFSANTHGEVVWAHQGSLNQNILAVDLPPRAFWPWARLW